MARQECLKWKEPCPSHREGELVDITEKMVGAGLRRVIVVHSAGAVAGIISDGDLVARVKPEARLDAQSDAAREGGGSARRQCGPTHDIMTPSALTGPASNSSAAAVQQMSAEHRKRFVVVDDAGHPIGIVDRHMLLRAVAGGEGAQCGENPARS
jgi:CBS domain-containing protein